MIFMIAPLNYALAKDTIRGLHIVVIIINLSTESHYSVA